MKRNLKRSILISAVTLAFALSASAALASELTTTAEPFAASPGIYREDFRPVYAGNAGTIDLNAMSVVKSPLWDRQAPVHAFAASPGVATDAGRTFDLQAPPAWYPLGIGY